MLLYFLLTTTWPCLTAQSTDDLEFTLDNRDHENVPLNGTADDYENFREGAPCKIVTHGWFRNANVPAVQDIKNGYQNCSDVNVIAVDWSEQARNLDYAESARDTQEVGEKLGKKIVELVEAGVCSLNSTHCIGHSLGAHVCANAAIYVQEKLGKNISRVTGLDPAGPLFENNLNLIRKLRSNVSDFVDAIHTDSFFGYTRPLAQADFYVNGQITPQPGCINILDIFCSHKRAFEVYAESICNRHAFLSTLCASYIAYESGRCDGQPTAYMGEYTSHDDSGTYQVNTKDRRPYSES